MLLLYHDPMSASSRAVRLLGAEYQTQFDLREERVWERREEFLTLNPAATVPVIVDGQAVVCGASVCAEYLDETRGVMMRDRRLFPDAASDRAEMRRIADWALTKLETEVTRYVVHERVTKRLMPAQNGGGAPDSQALRAARTNIRYHLRYLDWLAASRNWLAGDRMSFADCAAGAALSVLDYLGEIEWEDGSPLKEWYVRLKSRPAFRELLAERVRGVPPVSHYADLDF